MKESEGKWKWQQFKENEGENVHYRKGKNVMEEIEGKRKKVKERMWKKRKWGEEKGNGSEMKGKKGKEGKDMKECERDKT